MCAPAWSVWDILLMLIPMHVVVAYEPAGMALQTSRPSPIWMWSAGTPLAQRSRPQTWTFTGW